ncbi:MAG: hypothetical protein JWO36_6659 [Myxococcales bacterium]|nr:hypothetical protein [Myxococcales bacterium]
MAGVVSGGGASPVRARRVLVVDDNQSVAHALKRILETQGHAVAVAYDGPDALRSASEFLPDIALVDIGLPKMDGYELARRLREQGQMRLVAISGYNRSDESARPIGFDEYLVKPVGAARLKTILDGLA